jgi:hypothetical protein
MGVALGVGMTRNRMLVLSAPLLAAVFAALGSGTASATGEDTAQFNERCATRLSIAFLGVSAAASELSSSTPQSAVDTYLSDPKFQDRFASFINSEFNLDPGQTPDEDASYYLSKYILQNNRPWKELFVGQYNVAGDANGQNVQVTADPNGLGYFHSQAWAIRYAGNEQGSVPPANCNGKNTCGLKIVTAYRTMQNVLGLELVPSTNAPGADLTATGRMAAPCNGCHFNPWFALDNVAHILTLRLGVGKNTTFLPPLDAQATVFGSGPGGGGSDGIVVHNDVELVNAMVAGTQFQVNTCRLAFRFLYGRNENSCEGPLFDKCIDALKTQGTMQAALSSIAKDPSFCQ